MSNSALLQIPARVPSIDTQPIHPPGTSQYTEYKPQPSSRVRQAVMKACSNGSFVSRCLRVISRDGDSKNFETITGQDGLTFGITDFASNGGIAEFMELVHTRSPELFNIAFNGHVDDLLNKNWIKTNNGGGHGIQSNDNGLIEFLWLRKGLDLILTNPELRTIQLENFIRGKVKPSLTKFQSMGYVEEFTLATMIGIANSLGAQGLRDLLDQIIDEIGNPGDSTESSVARALLEKYVNGEKRPKPNDAKVIHAAYNDEPLPNESGLSHRGRRAYWLCKVFAPTSNAPFTALGDFAPTHNQ